MGWHLVAKAIERQFAAWNNGTAVLSITPAATDAITAAQATAGTSYQVRVRLTDGADGEVCRWAGFTLAASIADTTTPTPTISDATPTMTDGEALITVTLPAGAYSAAETVTVTIDDFVAPDGRTLTGGTSVLTIAA